jgi:hypothetical protein
MIELFALHIRNRKIKTVEKFLPSPRSFHKCHQKGPVTVRKKGMWKGLENPPGGKVYKENESEG